MKKFSNPTRMSQGGDVEGSTRTDDTQGDAVRIARASVDPGYSLETTLQDTSAADLLKGYCDYGHDIGDGTPSRNDKHYDKRRSG